MPDGSLRQCPSSSRPRLARGRLLDEVLTLGILGDFARPYTAKRKLLTAHGAFTHLAEYFRLLMEAPRQNPSLLEKVTRALPRLVRIGGKVVLA